MWLWRWIIGTRRTSRQPPPPLRQTAEQCATNVNNERRDGNGAVRHAYAMPGVGEGVESGRPKEKRDTTERRGRNAVPATWQSTEWAEEGEGLSRPADSRRVKLFTAFCFFVRNGRRWLQTPVEQTVVKTSIGLAGSKITFPAAVYDFFWSVHRCTDECCWFTTRVSCRSVNTYTWLSRVCMRNDFTGRNGC